MDDEISEPFFEYKAKPLSNVPHKFSNLNEIENLSKNNNTIIKLRRQSSHPKALTSSALAHYSCSVFYINTSPLLIVLTRGMSSLKGRYFMFESVYHMDTHFIYIKVKVRAK